MELNHGKADVQIGSTLPDEGIQSDYCANGQPSNT